MKPVLAEARLIDLQDGELKEFLGHTYESIKKREEAKRNDLQIKEMREALKKYTAENYTDEIKSLRARLKAARTVANARGIEWRLPKEAE